MSAAESADDYPVVAILNPRWRVIECGAGIQWILQHRASAGTHATARWVGRKYCRTKEALIRSCRLLTGEIEPAACTILAALPERIAERQAVLA